MPAANAVIYVGELHLHFHEAPDTASLLQPLIERLDAIMSAQEQATAALVASGEKLDAALSTLTKVSTETGALLVEVQTLRDIIAGMGEVSPELQAAIDAVGAKAQAVKDAASGVDAQVPDEPPAGG